MHAYGQTRYVDYASNSSYISQKQNKTHIAVAKNKADFTAVNISIGHRNFFAYVSEHRTSEILCKSPSFNLQLCCFA